MKYGPTIGEVYKRQGMKAAINLWAERKCAGVISDMHKDAKSKGYNLFAPDWKDPWWFKWMSKLERYTR